MGWIRWQNSAETRRLPEHDMKHRSAGTVRSPHNQAGDGSFVAPDAVRQDGFGLVHSECLDRANCGAR